MRVRFFAYIRDYTGCAEADLPYCKTAGELARSLCELYGEKLRHKIFPSVIPSGTAYEVSPDSGVYDKFGPEIIFLINGRHVNHLGGVDAPLAPNDNVDIFPVAVGG